METRQLRYFVGVAETGSLLKASARLHVAQPALGQQMAALERELDTRLFERSHRGMSLTEAGRSFLPHARLVLADIERARAAVRDASAQPRGDVVVGLPMTIALAATVPLVQACRQRYPQVRLQIIEAYSGFVHEWLLDGRLDLAILYGDQPEPALDKWPLLDEPLAWVTPAGMAPDPAPVPLERLAGHELVLPGRDHGLRRIIDTACAAQGLALNVVAEIDSLANVKRLVEAGVGTTVLPLAAVAEEWAAGRLAAVPLGDARLQRRLVLATPTTRPASLAREAVAALAAELIRTRVAAGSWPGQWIGGDAGPAPRGNGLPARAGSVTAAPLRLPPTA